MASLQLVGAVLLAGIGGWGFGLWCGRRIWGKRWFDTSEGIDRRFRKVRF